MNIEPATPTTKGSPDRFVGDVWVDGIAAPHEPDQRMSVAIVRFAPGARTAWHSHERGQYLRVTQGTARFGTRDGQVIEVHPGQTIYTPPGQEHWHAAADDGFMEHLAMLESGDDPATTTTWNEHVIDEARSAVRAEPVRCPQAPRLPSAVTRRRVRPGGRVVPCVDRDTHLWIYRSIGLTGIPTCCDTPLTPNR